MTTNRQSCAGHRVEVLPRLVAHGRPGERQSQIEAPRLAGVQVDEEQLAGRRRLDIWLPRMRGGSAIGSSSACRQTAAPVRSSTRSSSSCRASQTSAADAPGSAAAERAPRGRRRPASAARRLGRRARRRSRRPDRTPTARSRPSRACRRTSRRRSREGRAARDAARSRRAGAPSRISPPCGSGRWPRSSARRVPGRWRGRRNEAPARRAA